MTSTMRSLMLGGAAVLWMSGAAVVHAFPGPNPSDFTVIETIGAPGQYTVIDNSSFWSVYGLEVTHSNDASNPVSNRPGWVAGSCFGSCFGNANTFTYFNNSFSNVIGPGSQSNNHDFEFDTLFAASLAQLFLVNGDFTTTVDVTTTEPSQTPLPASLPLMATVLGGGWFALRRRKHREAARA